MGQIALLTGFSSLTLLSVFVALFSMLNKLSKERDKTELKSLRVRKNGQIELIFLFVMFVGSLVGYLTYLLGWSGLFSQIQSMPIFLILGAFTYKFFLYVKQGADNAN